MKKKKWIMTVFLVLALTMLFGMTVCAAGKGDVAGAIEKNMGGCFRTDQNGRQQGSISGNRPGTGCFFLCEIGYGIF